VKGNGVTFGISQNQSPQKGDLIIDPWLIVPSSLSSDNAGYDLEVDDYGNVYVAGGTVNAPYKLAKYDASGNLLWTFTNPVDWNPDTYCYSKFCLLPKTGTTFMGEGFNSLGPRIMKIGSDGALETTSANFGPNNEIWLMFYNRCQGQLVAFGGGTSNMTNVLVISDTNLQSSTPHNFNGSAFDCCNDIAAAQMDYNGDFYALMPKSTGDYSFPLTCRLQKCLTSSNYDPPLAFNSDAECDFLECSNPGIPGFGDCADGATVRANALALNLGNVFTYDGKTLKAWNKSNGSQISSIIVNSGYAEGMYRQHEGIAVDECGNVYVAGNNCVHVLQFNGSSFNTIQTINSLPGQVYDITIDQASGMLYVSGLGFVTCIQVTSCGNNQLTLTHSEDCGNSATITASGGTPPYSYIWSNGSTEQTVTGTSGVYYVTVTDNSCITLKGTDSVSICSIFIPNVFTPDGDGHNDQFVILYDGWEIYHLLIYNRWGKLMFESNDKNTHWNGKAPNKEDAAVGVYYYVLNIGTKSYSGTVTLLR
jgi:gliding motility-associated-like protein